MHTSDMIDDQFLDLGIPMSGETSPMSDVLPPLYPVPRNPITPWPAKLPLELALGGAPVEEIFLRCGVENDEYLKWATMPAFRKALSDAAAQVRDQGASFRVLCHGIAMDFLPTLDAKLHDETIGLPVKVDILKKIVQWAGLEPKEEKVPPGQANMVNIQINM